MAWNRWMITGASLAACVGLAVGTGNAQAPDDPAPAGPTHAWGAPAPAAAGESTQAAPPTATSQGQAAPYGQAAQPDSWLGALVGLVICFGFVAVGAGMIVAIIVLATKLSSARSENRYLRSQLELYDERAGMPAERQ